MWMDSICIIGATVVGTITWTKHVWFVQYWVNPVACQWQSQLQLRPIATTIALCKHPVTGLTKPPAASILHLSNRTLSYLYMSCRCGILLCVNEYPYLANVHFCDIPHTFIPHFTLHSTEKIRIAFSANYLFTTFRIPQHTPSRSKWLFCNFCVVDIV